MWSYAALPELKNIAEQIAEKYSARVKLRPGGGIKSDTSIGKKVAKETNGRYDKVIDTAALSVVFDSLGDIQKAFEEIKNDDRVYEARDRFKNPMAGGYRDMNIKIGLSNGHVGEIQFILPELDAAKEAICHQLYDLYKGLEDVKGSAAAKLQADVEKTSEAIYKSTFEAKNFALSSEHLSALYRIWAALSPAINSRLSPDILYNLRVALLKTKGTFSLSKNSKTVSFSDI